ncbi:MAG: helix-hairpin-helix domain-containing protein [Thermoplasmata archaeon]
MNALAEMGPRTREKLLEAFGSPENVLKAADNLELDRFAAIRGISERRAVDLISELQGRTAFRFLRTEAAASLHEDIVRRLQKYANTSYARNKVRLLRPLSDSDAREALLDRALTAKKRMRQVPRSKVASLLRSLPDLHKPRPVFDSGKAVVVEDPRLLEEWKSYQRYCEILLPGDLHRPEEYDLILYVAPSGSADVPALDQLHVILGRPEPWQVFPESIVDFFRGNEEFLRIVRKLEPYLGDLPSVGRVLHLLENIQSPASGPPEEALRAITVDLNDRLRERLSGLSLEGEEVLELLAKGLPPRVLEVFHEVMEEGESDILRQTGLRIKLDPSYPLRLPEEEVARALRDARRRATREAFESLQQAARLLLAAEDDVHRSHRAALELDFDLALGGFALDYDLQRPTWSDALRLRGALHLSLVDGDGAQRIDYALGEEGRVALLTGANSGGKTTLLETLAQVYIMAAMGLPVSAREAVLAPLEGCYFFSRQRTLSAGALEGFLTTFMPLAMDPRPKLILADELESLTEPDAAGALIATFLEMALASGSSAIVVTHTARSVLRRVDVRVDGIEARGLDEAHNLIVDRTPRRDRIARSTPELILRRLIALKPGKEAELYERVLEKLQAG